MKHIIIIICLSIGLSSALSAQNRRGAAQERIESQRIAFITEKLELTPTESQAFWPIYNEYHAELKKLRAQKIVDRGEIKFLSDEEADIALAEYLTKEEEKLELKRTYFQRFRSAISPRKIVRILPAEEAFNRAILNRLRGIK